MKTRGSITSALIIIMGIGLSWSLGAPRISAPNSLAGDWVGFTSNASDFYRLELDGSRGVFACTTAAGEVLLYDVSCQLRDEKDLFFALRPISGSAYPIFVKGKTTPSGIDITVEDPEGGWFRSASLHKDKLIQERLRKLKEGVEKYKAKR